jgi:ribosomal protein L34
MPTGRVRRHGFSIALDTNDGKNVCSVRRAGKIKWALVLLPAPTASEFGFHSHKDHKHLFLTSGSPISPEGFLGLPRYFGYPIRRCVTCVSPHMIFVFFVPTISITSPVLRQAAYPFGDLAFPLLHSAFPFPVQLCVEAFLPDDLKLSCFSSRAKRKLWTYPQAAHFAVDKMENNF